MRMRKKKRKNILDVLSKPEYNFIIKSIKEESNAKRSSIQKHTAQKNQEV